MHFIAKSQTKEATDIAFTMGQHWASPDIINRIKISQAGFAKELYQNFTNVTNLTKV